MQSGTHWEDQSYSHHSAIDHSKARTPKRAFNKETCKKEGAPAERAVETCTMLLREESARTTIHNIKRQGVHLPTLSIVSFYVCFN